MISEEMQNRIAMAVREAESHTSGEIVPFFAKNSDAYHEAGYKGALVTLAVTLGMLLSYEMTEWGEPFFNLLKVSITLLVVGAVGFFAGRFGPAPVRRWFIGNATMETKVRQAALSAFVRYEVFNTRDRTGVLIYVSSFEKKVVVLGDSGINTLVKEGEWDGIVEMITDGIRSGDPATGIVRAVQECGMILKRSGLKRKSDDENELPDQLQSE